MASIYKREKAWYLYYRLHGKRVRKKIGTPKKIAQLALADVIVKLEKSELGFSPPAKQKNRSIHEFLTDYQKYSQTNHRPSTIRRYRAIVDNFRTFLKLHPALKRLPHLTPKHFEEYKTYRRDTPVTVNGRKSGVKKQAKSNTVNTTTLGGMMLLTVKAVKKWLNRRSQQRKMSWERFTEYLGHYPLAKPKIVHVFTGHMVGELS